MRGQMEEISPPFIKSEFRFFQVKMRVMFGNSSNLYLQHWARLHYRTGQKIWLDKALPFATKDMHDE